MEGTLRQIVTQDWITLIVLAVLILVTLAKVVNPQRFASFIALPYSDTYFSNYDRKQKTRNLFTILLFTVQFIVIPLCIYALYNDYTNTTTTNLYTLFLIVLGYLGFVLGKQLLVRIIGYTLQIQHISTTYFYHRLSYTNYISILLFVIFVIVYYIDFIPINVTLGLIYFVGLVFLISIVVILMKFKGIIITHLFYFILYFCALEIAPYYILYKVFVK